jgi:hypothetical protein
LLNYDESDAMNWKTVGARASSNGGGSEPPHRAMHRCEPYNAGQASLRRYANLATRDSKPIEGGKACLHHWLVVTSR